MQRSLLNGLQCSLHGKISNITQTILTEEKQGRRANTFLFKILKTSIFFTTFNFLNKLMEIILEEPKIATSDMDNFQSSNLFPWVLQALQPQKPPSILLVRFLTNNKRKFAHEINLEFATVCLNFHSTPKLDLISSGSHCPSPTLIIFRRELKDSENSTL